MELTEFKRLYDVVSKLRDPNGGCPWDLKQTHQSLLRFLQEESYEFIDAVEDKNDSRMEDELGDVLLQVLLHSVIGKQRKAFDLESVSKNLADKLIRRHPHVFENPEGRVFTDEEIKENWQKIKGDEKSSTQDKVSSYQIEKDILAMPSLLSAYKIGKKTEYVNFDWDDYQQVSYKVEEEWQELKEEISPGAVNKERAFEEIGDFLFSAAQLARHLDFDPEEALRAANKKFLKRYNDMEKLIRDKQLDMKNMTQTELDHYWQITKMNEK
tara:strand:- start:74249 stop:75055 length:807 start_codon:yes stop_codon:yes gene_type:complete